MEKLKNDNKMTDEQVLKEVIKKAKDNGFEGTYGINKHYLIMSDFSGEIASHDYYKIIFDHEFAKAFWGEELIEYSGMVGAEKSWIYHLQQIVLEEDKIKYLKRFL